MKDGKEEIYKEEKKLNLFIYFFLFSSHLAICMPSSYFSMLELYSLHQKEKKKKVLISSPRPQMLRCRPFLCMPQHLDGPLSDA